MSAQRGGAQPQETAYASLCGLVMHLLSWSCSIGHVGCTVDIRQQAFEMTTMEASETTITEVFKTTMMEVFEMTMTEVFKMTMMEAFKTMMV